VSTRRRRFLGTTPHPVDSNGRMSIARKHHKALDRDEKDRPCGIVCLEPGEGECLWVLNDDSFDRELGAFRTSEEGADSRAREAQRGVFRHVDDFSLDKSGRFTIPQKLRKLAGIEDEVIAMGVDTRLELWPRAAYEARYGPFDPEEGA